MGPRCVPLPGSGELGCRRRPVVGCRHSRPAHRPLRRHRRGRRVGSARSSTTPTTPGPSCSTAYPFGTTASWRGSPTATARVRCGSARPAVTPPQLYVRSVEGATATGILLVASGPDDPTRVELHHWSAGTLMPVGERSGVEAAVAGGGTMVVTSAGLQRSRPHHRRPRRRWRPTPGRARWGRPHRSCRRSGCWCSASADYAPAWCCRVIT